MFLWKNKEDYPQIIPVTPSFPKHCVKAEICEIVIVASFGFVGFEFWD